MAEQTNNLLKTRIVLRNDSTSMWLVSKDQVLLKGEVGIEFLNNGKAKMKIGDGETTWENLAYFGGDECRTTEIVVTAGSDHKTAIDNTITGTINRGDIAIIKEEIVNVEDNDAEQRYQYTAYVYGEDAEGISVWKAMDGNYSADTVYFKDDMLVTKEVGYITLTNGQAYIPSKGKNLTQVFEAMYVQEKDPTITQPQAQFVSVTSGAKEVGTKLTPEYSVKLTAGSYEFGPATGITAASWSVEDSLGNALTTATGSFPELQVTDTTDYYIEATATHGEGSIPVTNKGNEYFAGKIASGNKTVSGKNGTDTATINYENKRITGFRYHFFGAQATKIDLTGAKIREAYAKDGNRTTSTSFNITVPDGATQVIIALKGRKINEVKDSSAMNQDIASAFTLHSTTETIPGANGYTGVAYNIYVYTPETKLPAATYAVTTKA